MSQVKPPRHAVEAETLLDAKGAVELERQLEQTADQHEGGQQRELIGEVAEARLDRVAQRRVERVEAAQQGPADQNSGSERGDQQTEARLRQRVVGRALVTRQHDGLAESFRHSIAMGRDVADLTRRQPELD